MLNQVKIAVAFVLAGFLSPACKSSQSDMKNQGLHEVDGAKAKSAQPWYPAKNQGIGVNQYCDPLGTKYPDGSPLGPNPDQKEGVAAFLKQRGLNIYCDPLNQKYLGGTPLFNEATQEQITAEQYRAHKKWARGLNEYCDPLGTVYQDGSPLFIQVGDTRRPIDKEAFLARQGLNRYCDPEGTFYLGGTPLFDEATGQRQSLEEYLSTKFRIF